MGLHLTLVISIAVVEKIKSVSSTDSTNKDTIFVDLKENLIDKGQIVNQDETTANEQAPDKADFLSAKNNKVAKQTIAKNKGEFKNAPTKTKGQQPTPTALAKNLFPSYHQDGLFKKMNESANAGGGPEQSQTDDYVKGVDEGFQTMLNAKEFKYYTYYNRIRRQLSQFWEPKVKEKMTNLVRQGRNVASNQERVTKLLIVLNSVGTLMKVQVLSDSGIQDLDDAAIEAFRAAAPFPNPPKGIVENDGTVKIRWDFILES